MEQGKVIILMMDSLGVGGAADAAVFGDAGANTLGAVAKLNGGLKIPNMSALGLLEAASASCGYDIPVGPQPPAGLNMPSKYGYMKEISKSKDTSSGHWEMAGAPVTFSWGYFKPEFPSFPPELVEALCREAGLKGILCNKAASGTEIINELGPEHIKTGLPICYTSADSVFQIAAHEKYFGLARLYKLCETAFKHLKPYHIARVIARPFEGEARGSFKRTKNRRDYSVPPPADTMLDKLASAGGSVISVGKTADIFANRGITRAVKASGLGELWDKTLEETKTASARSIVFTNFVDFDMVWGHRRDAKGYAGGIEYFDGRLPQLAELLQPGDIVFITADHGCDPSYKGTDHTRENVPVIMFGKNVKARYIGGRKTFADIAQTIARYFNMQPFCVGESFLD